jgi:2-succinyl-5-enolpyruvyl-6-hydroxy-3-cyclohexene-1-carboxylate synthase
MLLQPIINIAEICAQKGVCHVVISPGSRSAALTLAFARHPDIQTKVIADERVAGFVALGMAQQLGCAVALVCTSGSAAYNLSPAVVEAFFQEIPLLVFTADRPKEWIGQQDGQTMYQMELYGKHVKKAFDLPADYVHADSTWFTERAINEAINLAHTLPKGPVHVNVPIREPFYPTADERFEYDRQVRIIEKIESQTILNVETWHRLQADWDNAERIIVAVGQMPPNAALMKTLQALSEEMGVVVLGDVIGNVPNNVHFVTSHDVFLGSQNEALFNKLKPDLLITIGNSFLSKHLKTFIRKHKPAKHWHVKQSDGLIDAFQALTTVIPVCPNYFFSKLIEDLDYQQFIQHDSDHEERAAYRELWLKTDRQAKRKLTHFLKNEPRWNEFAVVEKVLENLSQNAVLHLANSMAVRYANLIGVPENIDVWANRGVSGIDGCTSTAVGAALQTDKLVFLITGDVAFFYDRNALWHSYIPKNLRIVLLNNAGGNIFRLIDGPSAQPELEQYFETRHQTTAKRSVEDAQMSYSEITEQSDYKMIISNFIQNDSTAKLLEIFTDPILNGAVFGEYKQMIRRQ